MKARDRERAKHLLAMLADFERDVVGLPGIRQVKQRQTFVAQLLESIRRIEYIAVVARREIAVSRCDPRSEYFDPHKAASLMKARGEFDEAFWMLFLSVHFGRNAKSGWQLLKDVYAGPRSGDEWTWKRISVHSNGFGPWLTRARKAWKDDGVRRSFGNHRKYESLGRLTQAIQSYVRWVAPPRTHAELIQQSVDEVGSDPGRVFDHLYHSMSSVLSFGRTARFDYLTMVGKIGLASIEPASPYLIGSTGPLKGAKLLFGSSNPRRLESQVIQLGRKLAVGMQAMEDSLCNWQKSPARFVPFRG